MPHVVRGRIFFFGLAFEISLRADAASPTISSLTTNDLNDCHCVVSNLGGTVTGSVAMLDLTDAVDGKSRGEGKI